MTFQEKPVLKE